MCIIKFVEEALGCELLMWQKHLLVEMYKRRKEAGHIVINIARDSGKNLAFKMLRQMNMSIYGKGDDLNGPTTHC